MGHGPKLGIPLLQNITKVVRLDSQNRVGRFVQKWVRKSSSILVAKGTPFGTPLGTHRGTHPRRLCIDLYNVDLW